MKDGPITMEEKKTPFWWHNQYENVFVASQGYRTTIDGLPDLVLYVGKTFCDAWSVTEAPSGASFGGDYCDTRKELLCALNMRLQWLQNKHRDALPAFLAKIRAAYVAKYGLSPLYKQQEVSP